MVYNWLLKTQKRCLLCGLRCQQYPLICDGCWQDLPWLAHSCRGCALPIPPPASFCGRCQQKPPPWSLCQSLFYYRYPARELISTLKFSQDLSVSRLLGWLLTQRLLRTAEVNRIKAIIPVPLHPSRLKSRGFNQSLELARHCAHELKVPLLWKGCTRIKATEQQANLKTRHRRKNLKGAFAVTAPLPDSVLLIDDVMTTGTTLNELALTLNKAGVSDIQSWTICRTVLE